MPQRVFFCLACILLALNTVVSKVLFLIEVVNIQGRDTAGLGGKGGPYRLDAGHTVHQLSDAEKNAVPEHVKKAAREMGQRAFKKRLKEIQMSEADFNLYDQFSKAVQEHVQTLRIILGRLFCSRTSILSGSF